MPVRKQYLPQARLVETDLFVRGKPFNHHDTNTLKQVEAPTLNPLAQILEDRAT